MELGQLYEKIRKNGKDGTYIYGAGKIAQATVSVFEEVGLKDCIKGIIVTSFDNNPQKLKEYEIKEVGQVNDLKEKLIILSVVKKYQGEILDILKEHCISGDNVIQISNYTLYILAQQGKLLQGKPIVEEVFGGRYNLCSDIKDKTYGELKGGDGFRVKIDPSFVIRDFNLYKMKWKDYDIEAEYFKEFGHIHRIEDLECQDSIDEINVDIYMISSHKDYSSSTDHKKNELIPLQAGAALTDIEKYDIRDNKGDSISEFNKTLCELTGIYWVWKNSPSRRYKGVCHYRRQFDIGRDSFCRIITNDVDAVLTTPRFNAVGNLNTFLLSGFITSLDIEIVESIIKEKYPEYEKSMKEHFKQNFFYNCNMVLAKEEVFNEWCEFLFGVILPLDRYFRDGKIERTNKFSAYFAELVTSLFFYHNRDRFKIATCDFRFYE